jgi:cobalt-zinc-cadmium efflux system membrane fusion protein
VQLRGLALVIDTVTLEQVAIPLDIPATVGTPDPATAHLGSIVEGRVVRVPVLPGDHVRAGAPVVIIHSHELSAARRDLAAAEAEVSAAGAALDRSAKLLDVGAVSLEEVEQRRATFAAARAEQKRAEDLVKHLHPDGDDVTIVAPTDGTVMAVRVNPGEAVTVGMPLVEIGDARSFWVTGWVPERAVPQVRAGGTARVVLAAFPGDTFTARVVRTGGALDPVRRALDVRVALEHPPAGVVPGMYATILLSAGDRVERAVLPAEAVQRTAQGAGVFLRETANRFRFRPVASAIALPDGTVAVEGLEAGLEVVTAGAFRLHAAANLGGGVPDDH